MDERRDMKVHSWFRKRGRRVLTTILLPMMLASCSGNTNSTGPAPPLPTGQPGALYLWKTTNAGCYVPDGTGSCPPSGTTYSVTALATQVVSSSSQYLYVGDSQGNVYAWTASSSAPSTVAPCSFGFSSGTFVNGLASYFSSSTYYVYAVDGSNLEVNSGSSSPCSSSSSYSTISSSLPTSTPTVGLAIANGFVFGVTSTGQYYSVAAGNTTSLTQTPTPLLNLPSTATIGGITADQKGIVFMTDYANSAIYAYYANSNGTLTRINGTFSGNVDVTNPRAITTVHAPNPTSSGCTTGACEFLYVTNYSYAVVQLVLSISGTAPNFSVGYTEFNAPYTSCEIIDPVAMTSFPNVVNPSISSNIPWVFIGQNGTETSSSCFGASNYGDSVTAYDLTGE